MSDPLGVEEPGLEAPGGEDSVASLEPNSDSPAAADNTKGHTRHNSSSLMEPTDETMEEISLPSSPGEPDAPTSPKRRSEEAQPGNSASAAVDGTLTVTVDNPMKHGDGLFDSHVVFTVNTKTTRSQFAGTSFSVHRRYSDFVWLREMLCHEQRGQIIPPLPPKHVTTMNKFDPVFLNTRRLALQRFILRIVQHEILTHNSSFLHFLQAKAHEFVSIKKEKARGVMDKMSESLNMFATKLVIKNADQKFIDYKFYIHEFDLKMKALCAEGGQRVLLLNDFAKSLKELYGALQASCESEPQLTPVFGAIMQAIVAHQRAAGAAMDEEQDAFVAPLTDYSLYGECIQDLLKRRDVLQLNQQMMADDLAARKKELAGLKSSDQKKSIGAMMGKDPSEVKAVKIEKVEAAINTLEQQAEQASDDLEVANANVSADMERWTAHKNSDMREVFSTLAASRVKYYKATSDAWQTAVHAIEAME